MKDKLSFNDWKALINKTTTLGQIRSIADALDDCWRIDGEIMQEDDWPAFMRCIQKNKARIQENDKS